MISRVTPSKSRNANFYLNGGYAYDNRYLLDVNLRSDGTSVFGANKRFSTTWAVGVAWNLHKENFLKNHTNLFNVLKVRASIGNPGNQNFGSYSAITTYYFNNWMLNDFGTGLLILLQVGFGMAADFGQEYRFGLDVFSNRFHINFDYYHKRTDPLIATIKCLHRITSRRANIECK